MADEIEVIRATPQGAGDGMGDIERWWLVTAPTGEAVRTVSTREKAEDMAEGIEGGWIEVVPASEMRGAVETLDEILRVIDGIERGEPFGTEDMAMSPLEYIGTLIRQRGQ